MSLLDKLDNIATSSFESARVAMTPEQITAISAKLKTQNRINVQPNRFDIDKPFQVSLNFNNVWHNHGVFTNVDAATAAGSLLSLSYFGSRAKKGSFNKEIAESHPEFLAWLEDEANKEVVKNVTEGTCVLELTGKKEVKGDFDDDLVF